MRYDFESMEEKDIIELAKKDISAFEYLYETNFQKIFQYVMYRVNLREVAEDIVSIVFTKAMNNLKLFKWRGLGFQTWLYRIAYNEICNHAKREKKLEKINRDVMNEDRDSTYEMDPNGDVKSYDFIYEYIRKLPLKDQDIITLRFFEKKSFAEIAQISGKNESTLRVNLHRALKKLEALMPTEVLNHAYRQISM